MLCCAGNSDDDSENLLVRETSVDTIDRKCTNPCFLFLKIILIVALSILMFHCFKYGNIYRVLNGYDDCGNICGKLNPPDPLMKCKGIDMRSNKFLLINVTTQHVKLQNSDASVDLITQKRCVNRCDIFPGYKKFLHFCIKINGDSAKNILSKSGAINFFVELLDDFSICWHRVAIVCGGSMIIGYFALISLRYTIRFIVWFTYVSIVVTTACVSITFMTMYIKNMKIADKATKRNYLIAAGVAGIITCVLIVCVYFARHQINYVIRLFIVASKVFQDVPQLLFQPLLTLLSLLIVVGVSLFSQLIISSAGHFSVKHEHSFDKGIYVKDGKMILAQVLNVVLLLWTVQIILGCQQFVIAGTVCRWFFTRDKRRLGWPICRSMKHLTMFHLGSICLGSFIISFVRLVKIIIDAFNEMFRRSESTILQCLCCCCSWLVDALYELIRYLTNQAYIVIALKGIGFFAAGKKAFNLLVENPMRVALITSIGNLVFGLLKLLVTTLSAILSIFIIKDTTGVTHDYTIITICSVFAFCIVHCFLAIFETSVDAIFICFCIDIEENNGHVKPYYMSHDLMTLVQDYKESKGQGNNSSNSNTAVDVTPVPSYAPPTNYPHIF